MIDQSEISNEYPDNMWSREVKCVFCGKKDKVRGIVDTDIPDLIILFPEWVVCEDGQTVCMICSRLHGLAPPIKE